MQRKGPRKPSTRKLIAELEKAYRKSKKRIWLDLARILQKPRRNECTVNLWELEKIAGKFKGKTLLVPGKVLGTGGFDSVEKVAALEFSESAKNKLGSNAIDLNEVLEKVKPSEIVIVK